MPSSLPLCKSTVCVLEEKLLLKGALTLVLGSLLLLHAGVSRGEEQNALPSEWHIACASSIQELTSSYPWSYIDTKEGKVPVCQQSAVEQVQEKLSCSTSAPTSGNATVQPDCSSGYEPWVVGVAAGIPSILALVLAVILAVVCILQWKNYSWNQMNQHPNGQEGHEHESSPPRPPDDFYMTMMQGTTSIYVNEDQDKHHKLNIQKQPRPMRTKEPRRESPVVEYFYENHPASH